MKTRIVVSLFAVFAFCVFAEAAVKAEYNEAAVGLKKQVRGDSGRYGSHKGGKARNQAKPGPFSAGSPVLNDMAALGADVPKELLAYALEDNLKKTVLQQFAKCPETLECMLGVKLDPDGTTIGGGSVLAGTRRAKTRYCDISVSMSVVTDRDVLSGETYANILLKIKFDCQMWVLGHDSGTISITDAVRDSGCARH